MMKPKHRHSCEGPASSCYKTMPVALHSRDEALSKRGKNKTPRSPRFNRSSVPSDRVPEEDDVKTTSKGASWKAQRPLNQTLSRRDVSKSSVLAPPSRANEITATALRGSKRQEVPSNDGGDTASSKDHLLDSSRGSTRETAQQSETSGGGYFFPGWSISSEVAPAVCGAVFPLKCPSSERCRDPRDTASSRSTSAVPHMPEEHSRGSMNMSSNWTLQSEKSHLRGVDPQAVQRRMSNNSAVCSIVLGHSQCFMASSYSSSPRFSSPYKHQQQQNEWQQQQRRRKMAGIAPPNLNPKYFYPMLPMGSLCDLHRRKVDSFEALQPMRSRFGAANGGVPATISPWAESWKHRSGNIARRNGVHTGNGSPLHARQSCRAVDEVFLPMIPALGVLTASQSPLQSFFWAPMSARHRTSLNSATNGFDRGPMMLPPIYGTHKDGNEESSLGLGKHAMGPAGQSVPGDGYHSFFRSAEGPLPGSEGHPNGSGAGADEKSARRRGQARSLYGCMLNGVAVISSSSSDGEDGRGRHTSDKSVELATRSQWLDASPLQSKRITTRNSVYSGAFEYSGQLLPKLGKVRAALVRQSTVLGSGAWRGDGHGSDDDDSGEKSTCTDSRRSSKLDRKSTMNALRWMMEAGKGRLGAKRGGAREDSDSDDEGSVEKDKDSVGGGDDDERPQRDPLTRASRCAGLGATTAHGTNEAVGQSDTSSDEDADEGSNRECEPASQSRQTVLERISPGMERLSDVSGVDEEVGVQEKRPTLDIAPLLPFRDGGGGRGSNNTYHSTCPAVSHNRRPVFAHYCAQPKADIMVPTGYPGWSTGCGARAAAHLRNYGGCQQRNLSPHNENDWHDQLAEFISPSTTNGSGASTIPSSDAVPVTCESPYPIFRQTVTTMTVHELLGLDPELEIIRVKSPVWQRLPH